MDFSRSLILPGCELEKRRASRPPCRNLLAKALLGKVGSAKLGQSKVGCRPRSHFQVKRTARSRGADQLSAKLRCQHLVWIDRWYACRKVTRFGEIPRHRQSVRRGERPDRSQALAVLGAKLGRERVIPYCGRTPVIGLTVELLQKAGGISRICQRVEGFLQAADGVWGMQEIHLHAPDID